MLSPPPITTTTTKVVFADFDFALLDQESLSIERAETAQSIREKITEEAILEEYWSNVPKCVCMCARHCASACVEVAVRGDGGDVKWSRDVTAEWRWGGDVGGVGM